MENVAALAWKVAQGIELAHPQFTSFSETDKGFAISSYMHGLRMPEAVAQLTRAIAADDSLGHLRNGWFDLGVGGGHAIQDHMLPHVLVHGVLSGLELDDLLGAARRAAASNTGTVDTYVLVAGLDCASAITLHEGLELLPWDQIPDGRGKKWFADAANPAALPPGRFGQYAVNPTIAIRHRARGRKVLFASHDEAYPKAEGRLEEATTQFELTADVIRCLTAISVWPVGKLGSWSELDSELLNHLGASAFQYYSALTNIRSRKQLRTLSMPMRSFDCSRFTER